jgi:hypothetical protein
MTDDASPERYPLLNHPEVFPVLETVTQTIVMESDRGAVLVAASIVDDYLRRLFESRGSPQIGKKKRRELLEYPGPLSSLAAKVDIALLTELIDPPLHTAIHRLRSLRNAVAHNTTSFRLADHEERLRQISDLGPGVPAAVNRMANEFLMRTFFHNLEERSASDPSAASLFANPQEVLDHLLTMPDTMNTLQERAWRLELGISVGVICGMIVFYWERPDRDSTRAPT